MFAVELTPQGSEDLGRLDKPVAQRVLNRIHWLAENFESLAPQALTGRWRGVYKLRIGDYRALYTYGGWHARAGFLAALGDLSAGEWNMAIRELVELGQVEKKGEKRGTRYRAGPGVAHPGSTRPDWAKRDK